jgi:hypothetical protein
MMASPIFASPQKQKAQGFNPRLLFFYMVGPHGLEPWTKGL